MADLPDDADAIAELVAAQLEANGGVSAVRVSDGTVFTFTTECLERMLAQSIEGGAGAVVVFVKRGPEA